MYAFKKVLVSSLIVGIIFCFVPCVLSQDNSIKVTKSASTSKFNWEDTVVITLTIKNEGENAVNNITIMDYVPVVFEGEPKTLVDSTGTINITRDTLLPNEELSYSYIIKGKKDLGTELNITLRALQVSFKDEAGVLHLQKSDDIAVTVKSEGPSETIELLLQSAILLIFSFTFGSLGSLINNLDGLDVEQVLPNTAKIRRVYIAEGKEAISISAPQSVKVNKPFNVEITIDPDSLKDLKEESYKIETLLKRENQVWRKEVPWSKKDKKLKIALLAQITGEHSLKCSIINAENQNVVSNYSTTPVTIDVNKGLLHNLLVGGVAGIIILVSLEALSAMFADKGLEVTVRTMVTLTVSCVVAGFIPKKIIDSYTKTLVKEKEDAESQRDQVQQEFEEAKEQKKKSKKLKEELSLR